MATAHGFHDSYVLRGEPAGVVAVCACGWASDPHRTLGHPGRAWERHLREVADAYRIGSGT